ncbi:hypothetical protein HGRIS_004070 [Hohenbuehelia grisea]|uniref:Chromo domain-containing protein n=1 Tax=Hohenbuehelia grisea TaxID=104357 RepID=A0ABR3JHV7_9AGAR
MARTTSPAVSDVNMSDAERNHSRSKKDEEVEASEVEEEEEGGEEEEEYEIEEILDAKRGMFEGGRIGYHVKWKGYGPEHNSWVDEKDAGNAEELIDTYWAKKKSSARPRKSIGSAPKASAASQRQKSASAIHVEQSDDDSISVKKRRKSKGAADGDDARSSKKAKAESASAVSKKRAPKADSKVSANISTKAAPPTDDMEDEEYPTGNMDMYMNVPGWDHLVQRIDTVSRTEDDKLIVYFTLTTGQCVRADATICKERFPQKLIEFYESHLRWKTAEEPAQ